MTRTLFNLAIISTRILLGFIFFTAGMGKITEGHYFPFTIFQSSLAKMLAPYGLGLWGEFVAWSQIIIGFLLMSQRFATLGAIMLMPLALNIFIIIVSLGFIGTTYVVGFLICLNLFLLAADYHKLKFLFLDNTTEFRHIRLRRSFWQVDAVWLLGLTLCVAAALFHASNRAMTFSLSAAGIITFLAGGVWEYFLRKERQLSKKYLVR